MANVRTQVLSKTRLDGENKKIPDDGFPDTIVRYVGTDRARVENMAPRAYLRISRVSALSRFTLTLYLAASLLSALCA